MLLMVMLIFVPALSLAGQCLRDAGREVFDLEGYIRNFEAMIADGRLPSFHEKESAARIEQYGDIAHSFSTYEARSAPDSLDVLFRGINSIQLLRTDGKWRIVSLIWHREGPATPIPSRYLP